MRTRLFLLSAAMLGCMAGTTFAHGPQLDYVDDAISVHTEDTLSDGTPVYAETLAFNFINLGWQALPVASGGGHLVMGDTISTVFLDWSTLLDLDDPTYILFHDGNGFADPGSASFSILGTLTTISENSINNPVVPIGTVDNTETFHDHLGMLLANGGTGLYGFWISNTTTNALIADSDPYLLLLNNGLTGTALDNAVADFEEIIVVPEASTLLLTGAVALCGAVTMYRRKKAAS